MTGADVLPVFGCFNNLVRNNTILMAVRSRPALLVGNGSWGTRAFNNVLVNDETPSVELHNTSIWRFEAGHNVLDTVSYEGPAAALKSLALSLPNGTLLAGRGDPRQLPRNDLDGKPRAHADIGAYVAAGP